MLDDICRADPRYSWAQASDGSIQIHIGKERLSLLDVIVDSFHGKPLSSEELDSAVVMMPEVRAWSPDNKCNVGKVIVIAGSYTKPFENKISVSGNGQPLWKVLDQIAETAGTYFWQMVKFSNEPCSINLTPL